MKINAACDCRIGNHAETRCNRSATWRVEEERWWGLFTTVRFLCDVCLPYRVHPIPDGVTLSLVEP